MAIITGAAGGVGFEAALALARAGADVILADRNETLGLHAIGKIRPFAPAALVRFEKLDLADLASVADFAARIARLDRPLDLLINNGGTLALPERQLTPDALEMQFAANYLGHFALTGRLLPQLRAGMDPRVVHVGSISHRIGSIHLQDLQLERDYTPWKAYAQSKLALLMFALELQRRSELGAWGLLSMAAHAGHARTSLEDSVETSMLRRLRRIIGALFSHSAADGAAPILYAATSPTARPSEYYGPMGAFELVGSLGLAEIGKRAYDVQLAGKLWAISEELTGVAWPLAYAPPSRYPWPAAY